MEGKKALEIWLGALQAGPDGAARCLLTGAGFTKATNTAAPLFWEYIEPLCTRLQPHIGNLSQGARDQFNNRNNLDASELVEMLDRLSSRKEVAEVIFAEPKPPMVGPWRYLPWKTPVPKGDDSVYRTFEQWKRALVEHGPTHAAVLNPAGPAVILGRLLAEGALDLALSTNWDTYIELGAWLAGLDVERIKVGNNHYGHDGGERIRLDVYDHPQAVAMMPRLGRHPTLLKLHGGADHISEILRPSSRGAHEEQEARLREAFLVSTADLTHWRDASQWVQDAVSDALRAHRMLFVGVSGADPVTFRATRERVREWEEHARRASRHVIAGCIPQDELPIVAVNYAPNVRLESMLTVDRPIAGGTPSRKNIAHHVVQGDGGKFIRAAYAWFMVQRMAHSLSLTSDRVHSQIRDRLMQRMEREANLAVTDGETPLIDILCDSIGPSARWAAMSENKSTFRAAHHAIPDRRANTPVGRWRYAPWFRENDVEHEHVRLAAACALALSHDDALHVDPWSGIVHLTPSHPSNDLKQRAFFPIVWPWSVKNGFAAETERQLHRRFDWGRGRPALKSIPPKLHAVVLPDSVADELVRRGQPEIRVSVARMPMERTIDWWTEALK